MCAAAAVIAALPAALSPARGTYDSFSYFVPPSLHSFRLPLVPGIYDMLQYNGRAIVVFQAVVAALCWSALALAATQAVARPWCYIAFAVVLVVECSDYVSQWAGAILSDSLSLSLFALMLAMGLRWLAGRGSLVWVLVASWLWAFTRNTNGYLLVVVGVVGLVGLAVPAWRSRRALAAYGSSLVVGVLVVVASATGSLYKAPIEHVMLTRVLTNPQRTAWFVHHGMPISPTIRAEAGWNSVTGTALEKSPALAGYRAWIYGPGEQVYLEYAVTHPGWVISGAIGDYGEITPPVLGYYTGTIKRPWYPAPLADVLLDDRRQTLYVLLGGATVALAAVAIRRREAFRDRQLRWWLAVVATGILTMVGDWVGDSYEVGRHYVGATVQISIGACFLIALCVAALARRRESRPPASGVSLAKSAPETANVPADA